MKNLVKVTMQSNPVLQYNNIFIILEGQQHKVLKLKIVFLSLYKKEKDVIIRSNYVGYDKVMKM